VTPALHEVVSILLFKDNPYKVRIEEIGWMKYSVSHLWKKPNEPKAIIAPLDIAKIIAVYGDYEGNQVLIDDLFDTIIKTW